MNLLERVRCLLTFGQGVAMPMPPLLEQTDPIDFFSTWFDDAKKSGILLPESMAISTCSSDGQPSTRMVLLKEFNQDGFIFYTNYASRKSEELSNNNKISLLFHWNVLQRQVRIEGSVVKTSVAQSKKYFHSRDRGSQIGAWASKQSSILETPDELKVREQYYKDKFANEDEIPYPEFWGGWIIKPRYIEFWQGRSNRLHDRVCFNKEDGQWNNFKLHP